MADTVRSNTITGGELVQFVERLERIAEDQAALREDRKQVMLEAKAAGYSTAHIGWLVRERAMDPDDRAARDAERALYAEAAGLLGGSLGGWMAEQAGSLRAQVADRVEGAFAGVAGAKVTRGRKGKSAGVSVDA